jgi:hypothetical protein
VIELSQNELQRVKVIENAVEGRITVAEASPRAAKLKLPKIYSYAGRPALAVRP